MIRLSRLILNIVGAVQRSFDNCQIDDGNIPGIPTYERLSYLCEWINECINLRTGGSDNAMKHEHITCFPSPPAIRGKYSLWLRT